MLDKTVHAEIRDLNVLTQIANALSAQGKTLFVTSDGEATILTNTPPVGYVDLGLGFVPYPLPLPFDKPPGVWS